VLKENLGQTLPLHVLEDDVRLGPCTEQGLQLAMQKGWLKDFDILFTAIFIPAHAASLKTYKALYDQAVQKNEAGDITSVTFGVADLQHKLFACNSSYLVNPGAIQKLHDLYAEELARGPTKPADLFIRDSCNEGKIRCGVIFPFITGTRMEQSIVSSIGYDTHINAVLTEEIIRQSFFIGCDWNQFQIYIDRFFPLPPTDADNHKRILAHLLAHGAAKDFLGE
jgi:hypothetical protein